MWALGVVECHPILDDASDLEAVTDLFEIDRLLLQAAPQPFNEDVDPLPGSALRGNVTRGEVSATSNHGGAHAYLGQHEGPISLETFKKIQDIRTGRARVATQVDVHKDFVLRGAIACAECGVPFKSCWSKGKAKHYAYYVCQTRGCASQGNSVRRHKVLGAFEDDLRAFSPAPVLFGAARAICRDAWDMRVVSAEAQRNELEARVCDLTKQSDKLMGRILRTENEGLIGRYETKPANLGYEKAILEYKRAHLG